jgi:hypothetical protein
MAGHGSDPAVDRANHPNRKVGRESETVAAYKSFRQRGYSPAQSLDWARTEPGSSVKREPITRPISTYFKPHEINEYKA